MNKYNVGLLGCGDICDIYFKNCLNSEILNMAACASLHEEKAHRKAQEYNIPKACSIDDLINDPQIDIILNLTVPAPRLGCASVNPQPLLHSLLVPVTNGIIPIRSFFISLEADHCLI